MRRTQWMRFACLLLSVILVAGQLPATVWAEETAAGKFILVAEAGGKLVIAPEYITYRTGQTIGEALEASNHTFTGLDMGQITAINDVTGNYTRSDQNGGYDLTTPASSVTHYCFSERPSSESKPTEGMKLLMTAMADYLEEEEDVQKAAKAEYQEARKQFAGLGSDSAKTLAKSLTDAVNNYKAILGGQTYEIRFTDQSKDYSDDNFPGVTITVKNAYGKQWSDADHDGKLYLPFGSYTFSVERNGDSVSGSVDLSESKTIAVKLPETNRLKQKQKEFRLSGSYGAEDDEDSKFTDAEFHVGTWIGREVTVPVVDSFSGTVYVYAEYDPAIKEKNPKLTAIYTMQNATADFVGKDIPFESLTSGAYSVLSHGSIGNTVIYRLSWEEAGYTYSQDYTVNFVRTPTLASITVEDQNGTDQAATTVFEGTTSEYSYKVLDTVTKVKIKTIPLMNGYEIQINGKPAENGIGEVEINGDTDIPVTVWANGYENTYTLKIQPGKGQSLIFSSMKEVTLQVVNSNGVEIPYTAYKETDNSNRYRFTLVPGESYHYVATYDTYYHMADDLELKDYAGEIITVNFDDVEDWLTELAFGKAEASALKNSIPLTSPFQPDKHHYQTELVDTEHLAFIWAKAVDIDTTIEVMYHQTFARSLYHGKPYIVQVDSGKTTGTQVKRLLMDENPIENSVTVRLTKNINGVTYFQDYVVDFHRTLTLKQLSAACDGVPTVIQHSDGKTGFEPSVKEYAVKVSLAAKQLELNVAAPNGSLCADEEELGYRITVEEGDRKTTLKEVGNAVIALNGSIDTQVVTITVENDKAPGGASTYVVKLLKAPPVQTSFNYFPQSALLNIREVLSGERLWPDENGKFLLCEGYSYDYVLSEYGYITKAGRLEVTQNIEDELVILDGESEHKVTASGDGGVANIVWNLTAAPENAKIDTSMKAYWENFRGNNDHNAVVDVKIPTVAENGTLYWAKQIGSGIDSDAVGSPILVDGDIVTYASDNIFRIDPLTGGIVESGKMDHKSSFSITPPTYAEGMVFVALSSGCVQAFNAATLESLWIYKDPLGGQPNCPLTVENGYLYTGFWNSETGNANFVCLSITDENPEEQKEEKYASWFYTAKGGFYWAGAYVGDDFVLVGTDDGTNLSNGQSSRLLLLDEKTGKLLDSLDGLNGDIRSSIVHDNGSYYFTSKGGTFYCVRVSSDRKLTKEWSVKLENGVGGVPMSTSSPVVYNGRAYIGVSGAGQFSAYSGHNISVIDLGSRTVAYRVATQGYPQTSGLLTKADNGIVYVYFFDNMTPGKLRVLQDRPGATNPTITTVEGGRPTAYALFTPVGDHAQYAICSPIVDEYGTVYFKNDSAHLLAFGNTVAELVVTAMPTKTAYLAGESFDPSGMQITAVYANGKTRDVTDYVTFSTEPLTVDHQKITLSYLYALYQNQENGQEMQTGQPTGTPYVDIPLSVGAGMLGDVDGNGTVDQADAQMILDYEAQLLDKNLNPMVADVSGDSVIDSNDAVLILQYPEIITKFPAEETAEESQPTE